MARVRLDDDYRAVEALIGSWALEYIDPVMGDWHVIAVRPSLHAIVDAYDAICDGVPVEFDDAAAE